MTTHEDIFWGIVLVIILILCYCGYRIHVLMAKATGTTFQRFMSVFKFSGTILWARIVTTFGAVWGVLTTSADYLNASPMLQDATKAVFPPAAIPFYLVFLGFMFEYLRRRPIPANVPPVNTPLPPLPVAPAPAPKGT